MVQTRSQMKASGVQLPEVHGSRKRLDIIKYNNLFIKHLLYNRLRLSKSAVQIHVI